MVNHKKRRDLTTRSVLIVNFNNDLPELEKALIPLNWECASACDLKQSLRIIEQKNISVAIVIIQAGNELQVLNVVSKLQHTTPDVKWLAITTQYPIPSPYLKKKLATLFIDYYHTPIDWGLFSNSLGHLWGMSKLQIESKKEVRESTFPQELVGCSEPITSLKKDLKKVAIVDNPLLISGETGTGKGLCAQLIHAQSAREKDPFVIVNCGALPSSLIHSELFGHEKGAYTGAERQYIGRIERANNGTLFLDEIGDLPLDLQVNLLNFLDDSSIERLGGNCPIKVNCRIIFASHIDLENAVAEGAFREDLFHRLNILRIHVPSLRDYREDIEVLAQKFLARFAQDDSNLRFTSSALQAMLQYDWPGNVRELKNRVLRAIVMAEQGKITERDLGLKLTNNNMPKATPNRLRTEIDTETLLEALKRNNHNVSAASRQLNISRTTFYRLVKKCNIQW